MKPKTPSESYNFLDVGDYLLGRTEKNHKAVLVVISRFPFV